MSTQNFNSKFQFLKWTSKPQILHFWMTIFWQPKI